MQKTRRFTTLRAGEAVALNMPDAYLTASVDDSPEPVRSQIKCWLKRPGPGVWICGRSGAGKTRTATAIALELFRRGEDVMSVWWPDCFWRLRNHRAGIISQDEALGWLILPPVLLLDEISSLFMYWPLAADFRPVLKMRAEAGRQTIYTSHISISDYISFCDSEASNYLSGFTTLNLPPRSANTRDWTRDEVYELKMIAGKMIQRGWLTPEEACLEVPRRIARLKQAPVF